MIVQKWKQCGTCVQGIDHKAAGVVCQDGVAAAAANGVHAIALSDGGGSRKLSQIGSAVSTRAVCALLVERFDELYVRMEHISRGGHKAARELTELKLEILDAVLAALRAELTPERKLADFGCTLQFFATKDGRYVAGHVGDGVIAAIYQRGLSRAVEVLSHPENGDGPNITFFVTDHNAREHLRLQHGYAPQLEGVLMMSDGPEEVLYHPQTGMHPNTQKLFDNFVAVGLARYEAILKQFLEKTVAGRSFDDLSLNLLYLETVDESTVSPEYREELLCGIRGAGQVKQISAEGYLLDETRPEGAPSDLAFLRSTRDE